MKYLVKPWDHQQEAIDRALPLRDYALFFEQGCLARDAVIKVNSGGCSKEYEIEELYRLWNKTELRANQDGISKNAKVRSWRGDYIGLNDIEGVIRSGEKPVYALYVNRMKRLKATGDHKILTKRGWVEMSRLRPGDMVACDLTTKHQRKKSTTRGKKNRYNTVKVGEHHPYSHIATGYKGKKFKRIEKHRAVYEAHQNGMSLTEFQKATHVKNNLSFVNPKEFHIHHKDHDPKNNDISNLEKLSPRDHISLHTKGYLNFGHGDIAWRSVQRVEYVGLEMTYDIQCKAPYHNFCANNIVVHNSGKTMTAINMARCKYYEHRRLLRTLILGPPIVRKNWVREWRMHSTIKREDILMLDGPGKKRAAAVKALEDLSAIVITNYESLRNDDLLQNLLDWHPELIIFDESHKCKTYNSQTTKNCYQLARLAKHRYILTGTPVLNSPSDIFSQFKILDLGDTFGKDFFAFRAKYFVDKNRNMPKTNYFPDYQPKPGIEDVLNAKIKQKSMRVLKKDCLDLPPYVKTRVEIELTAEQKRVYDELKKDFVSYVSDTEAVVANMALTKALRLLQIATGFVHVEGPDGQTKEKIFKKNPRDAALVEVIEGIPESEKIIIWAVFKRNYDSIRAVCQKLGLELLEVHGGVSDKQKRANVDLFNDPDGPRVLLGHPASAGIGINLVSASYSIFYSRTFNLGDDLQAEARNYRGGSEVHEKVTRIDLVAPGTIDEYVCKSLGEKINLATRIVDIKDHV